MATLNKDEPVLVRMAAQAAVAAALGVLVTHGIITDTQASTWTQTLVPLVLAALPLIFGAWARAKVTPVAKVEPLAAAHAELAAKDGLLRDADIARVGLLIEDTVARIYALSDAVAASTAPTEAATAAVEAEPADVPDGMSAGAPHDA